MLSQAEALNDRFSAFLIRNSLRDSTTSLSYQSRIFKWFHERFGSYLSIIFYTLLVVFVLFLAALSEEFEYTHLVPKTSSGDGGSFTNVSAVTSITAVIPTFSPTLSPLQGDSTNSSHSSNSSNLTGGNWTGWTGWTGDGGGIIAIGGGETVPGANLVSSKKRPQSDDNFMWFTLLSSFFIWMCIMNVLRCLKRRYSNQGSGGSGNEYYQQNQENNGERDLGFLLRLMQRRNGEVDDFTVQRMRMLMTNRDFDGDDFEMLQMLDRDTGDDGSGTPRLGVSEAHLTIYPTHAITQSEIDYLDSTNDNKCNVCLAPYELGEEIRTIACMHKFHRECIDTWLRSRATCPICKTTMHSHST